MDTKDAAARRAGAVRAHLGAPGAPAGRAVQLGEEGARAVGAGRAVVALESTIVCHGMPYPENLRTALEVEAIVRRAGAVPATVAVLRGTPTVGLSRAQLERLARAGAQVAKVRSRRARGGSGGSQGRRGRPRSALFAARRRPD